MKKINLLFLLAFVCFAGSSYGQVSPCATVNMNNKYKAQNPMIEVYEKQMERDISSYYLKNKSRLNQYSRTSASSDSVWYDIPLVFHIQHNYGAEVIPDYKIFNLVAHMNEFYALETDTSTVVAEFKKYVGKAQIRFHLATKDPNGNPTKGITHRLSYLTYGGDDEVKMDQWPPSNYLNIWFEGRVGAPCGTGCIVVAFAIMPPAAAVEPYWDGVISNYQFINDYETNAGATGGSIEHECGHIFNLFHTFGNTNDPGPSRIDPATNWSGHCGDDDEVDDTPPTDGCLGCCDLNDTVCSQNYFKIYPSVVSGVDSLVNYPDTANEQNLMNYATCKVMFTKGQVARMQAALNSDIGHRDSLWSPTNLYNTGALVPTPDLLPINDFTVFNTLVGSEPLSYFTCPGIAMKFTDFSWNDTISSVSWTFNNGGASVPAATQTQTAASVNIGISVNGTVTTSFSQPGWVSLTLAATGNNSGTTTNTYPRAEFVADVAGTPVASYYQEFENSDTARWPIFNYYTNQNQSNQFMWQMSNIGFDDNNSIEYLGYDNTYVPNLGLYPVTGTPLGDYSDFYSIPFDFTSVGPGTFYLNYYYSGASRSSTSVDINDTLLIEYSTNKGVSWTTLASQAKENLDNRGAVSTPYMPTQQSDWAPMSIAIPTAARTDYTLFRFRYKPSVGLGFDGGIDVGDGSYSSGNNFFMDRINFNSIPASVNTVNMGSVDVSIAPNPTGGDAYVIVKDVNSNGTAQVVVSDVTGKIVYTTTQQLTGNETYIDVPHSYIAIPGLYLVQATTGDQTKTLKLVVY
jgi:hypothetical protein